MSSPFNNLEAITKQLFSAANSRSICSLKMMNEEGYRLVCPHGVFMSNKKKLMIACWQRSGVSEKGMTEGYKNLSLEHCENVLVLNKKFIKRRDFNPEDVQYGKWLFHI